MGSQACGWEKLMGEKGQGLLGPDNCHKDFKVYSQTSGLHGGAVCDKWPLPVEGGHESRNCVGLRCAYREVLYATTCLTYSSSEDQTLFTKPHS